MSTIILSTLNARYIHCSLGLRYLLANMPPAMQAMTSLAEFIIDNRAIDIAEQLLAKNPKIIGFGVYIWNIEQTTQVIAILKRVSPETIIIVGGPEVSFEHEQLSVVALVDYVICGQADLAFATLCETLLDENIPRPLEKIIHPPSVPLKQLALPYVFYTEQDIANRVLYVEASRGCPFKCEFCLSALDKTAWPFELDRFLHELESLYQRGARQFKFVDRTFNLKIESSIKIMEFFLARLDDKLFLHFELIPDHLPEKLKEIIVKFPAGNLQFEIGIQTFDTSVQALISRKQDNNKSEQNIRWLRDASGAHLHTDLILGLPGDDIESIERSFNQLVALDPHEIQVGILKRLRGTPIIRHTATYDMRYNPNPPYNILSSKSIDFQTMQRLTRFARFWDMIGNSGRFSSVKQLLLGDSPFARFMRLSDWLFQETGQTHRIALPRLFELLYRGLREQLGAPIDELSEALLDDFRRSGIKGRPGFIDQVDTNGAGAIGNNAVPSRQARHLSR